MKAIRYLTLAVLVVVTGLSPAQSPGSDKQKLIGAWHLVSMGEGTQSNPATEIKGTLIYTRDGHMSVQLMYPPSQAALSNDYVLNGYEASFGSYDVNEATHTVTHHVQGSVTRGLVGKDLPRIYQLSGNRLIIRSANPDEHWSVIWEHY
jgi:Lipocalin-like domain